MARPRLALLRNISGCFKVADKSVKNFDVVSYHRGQIIRFALFFYGSGGRTCVLNHIYIPPKSPFGKGGLVARLCLALLCNMSGSFKVLDKAVRNFDTVSYHRGNPRGFPLFFRSGGRTDVLNHIYIPPKSPFVKGGLVARHCLALLRNMNSSLNAALEAAKKEYERLGIPYIEEER